MGKWTIVSQLSTSAAPVVLNPSLDWRVLMFTVATTVATALVVGAAPAVRATRVPPIDALKEQGRSTATEGSSHFADALIIGQVALSLVLVVVAGLLVTTFQRLSHAPLGVNRDRSLVVTVTAPTVPASERNPFYHRLVRTVAAIPGVAAAGGSFTPPIVGTLRGVFVVSEPGGEAPPDAPLISQAAEVTPGWFAAYGRPILEGRSVDDHDTPTTTPVMVVNEAFVRRFLPGGSSIGKSLGITVRMGGDFPLGTKTIVGVVGDAVYRAIREPLQPTIYFPLAQRRVHSCLQISSSPCVRRLARRRG